MASSSVSEGSAIRGASPGALVVALALPLLFLHRSYQPGFSIGQADISFSDLAALAVVATAVGVGVRRGFAALRAGRPVWIASGLFIVWIAASTVYGAALSGAYPFATHFVTMAKWDEYALLAPAVPLLLRRRADLEAVLWSLGFWTAVVSLIALLGFVGLDVPSKGSTWHRQASLLGWSDFAALAGAAVLAGVAVRRGPLARLLLVGGVGGTILAGAVSAMLGIVTALGVFAIVAFRGDRRRAVTVVAVAAVIAVGAVAIRLTDLSAFQKFVRNDKAQPAQAHIQTYSHRTLLAYLGGRIWLGHPLLGVGWQGSGDPWAFERYLPDAHRRFPKVSSLAFPSTDRRYGVQLMYLQALADMGVVGLLSVVAILTTTFVVAARARVGLAGLVAALWTLFIAWCWTAQGFVAGIPLDALTWLTVGLAATGAAWRRAGV